MKFLLGEQSNYLREYQISEDHKHGHYNLNSSDNPTTCVSIKGVIIFVKGF